MRAVDTPLDSVLARAGRLDLDRAQRLELRALRAFTQDDQQEKDTVQRASEIACLIPT